VSTLFLAVSGCDFQNLTAEIVKRILVVGLFYFILDNATSIVDTIIQSFRVLSGNAGGVQFVPSDIFNAGVLVAQRLADNVSFWTDTSKSLGLLIAGGSAFTKEYAAKYLTYALSVGLKLMVMGLVVSIGEQIITPLRIISKARATPRFISSSVWLSSCLRSPRLCLLCSSS
jgi:type IV secretion system protein TrbL